jgi:hypothetical protein
MEEWISVFSVTNIAFRFLILGLSGKAPYYPAAI